jgi:hypothetical protein
VVFLKTAFEAFTGKDKSWQAACFLWTHFEHLNQLDPNPRDLQYILWSPAEKSCRTRNWQDRGKNRTDQVTDLEHWFHDFRGRPQRDRA